MVHDVCWEVEMKCRRMIREEVRGLRLVKASEMVVCQDHDTSEMA